MKTKRPLSASSRFADLTTADVVLATTWRESFDPERQLWAAGTVKGIEVVVFE